MNDNRKKIKVVLVTNIAGPIRFPIYNDLAKNKYISLFILFLAKNDQNRYWNINFNTIKFKFKILSGRNYYLAKYETPIYINKGLIKEIRNINPDVIVISSYNNISTILSLIYSRIYRKRIVLWTGSHLKSGFFKNLITEMYKKFILKRFDSYITYGSLSVKQLLHYGVKKDKIVEGRNTVDIQWFIDRYDKLQDVDLQEQKRKYHPINILYVGNLIRHKGVFNLIKAFMKLKNDYVGLIIVGEGPDRVLYENYVQNKNVKNIYFEGYKQKNDLINYYKISDIFVLPSFNEVWGLVVNEAMACCLPVIVSSLAGAAWDLVKDGYNGFRYDPYNVEKLSEKIKVLINNKTLRLQMGENSRKMIRDVNSEYYAKKILEAIELSKKNNRSTQQ